MALARPYPIYIVLTPFREIAPSVRVMFRALDKVEPYLDYIEGFYRDDGDEALVALQLKREAVEQAGPERFFEIVRRCNLPLIAPEKLTMERRVSFHHEHLSSFPTRVQRYRMDGESMVQSIVRALEEHVAYEQEEDEHYDMVEVSEPEISVIPEPIDDSEPRRRSSKWELPDPTALNDMAEAGGAEPVDAIIDGLSSETDSDMDSELDAVIAMTTDPGSGPVTRVDADTVPATGSKLDKDAEAAFDAAATRAFDASFGILPEPAGGSDFDAAATRAFDAPSQPTGDAAATRAFKAPKEPSNDAAATRAFDAVLKPASDGRPTRTFDTALKPSSEPASDAPADGANSSEPDAWF